VTWGREVLQLLTKDATLDDLCVGDYWEIYQEVRGWHAETDSETGDIVWKYAISLDKFVGFVGAPPSKADWSRYHQAEGQENLSRVMRNRLRFVAGRPPLPATVADTIAANVHPDAAVYLAGDDGDGAPAGVVVLARASRTGYNVSVCGDTVVDTSDVPSVPVRYRTRAQRASYRPFLRPEIKLVVERSGHSVEALILKGREAFEKEGYY
jgi:hypothetical protein